VSTPKKLVFELPPKPTLVMPTSTRAFQEAQAAAAEWTRLAGVLEESQRAVDSGVEKLARLAAEGGSDEDLAAVQLETARARDQVERAGLRIGPALDRARELADRVRAERVEAVSRYNQECNVFAKAASELLVEIQGLMHLPNVVVSLQAIGDELGLPRKGQGASRPRPTGSTKTIEPSLSSAP